MRAPSVAALLAVLFVMAPVLGVERAALERGVAAAAASPHPRLIFTPELEAKVRARCDSDPLAASLRKSLLARADQILGQAPCERQLEGRRLLGVSRAVLGRVLCCAAAYRLSGESHYAQRAEREMLAAAAFSDWNPSHWLDVAEMATALAFGYDWLHDVLPATSRDTIRQALLDHAFAVYTPNRGDNNWNDVCNGGMILAALAIAEHDQQLALDTIAGALAALPKALSQYSPEGAHPEGPHWYWHYATLYTVPTVAALESACGSDFGLCTRFPGVLASANYYAHMHGPSGRLFNYSDAGDGRPSPAPQLLWLAQRSGRPDTLWNELRLLRNHPATAAGDRFGPFSLLWLPEAGAVASPAERHFRSSGRSPVATHRSAWDDSAASFIALKGGSPGENHAHMDVGSFIAEADGVRWAIDLGAQGYHSLESSGISLWNRAQDSARWSVFRLNDRSHNLITIAGFPQRVDGSASFVAGGTDFSVLATDPVYRPALSAARRGVRVLDDRRMLVQDEITGGAAAVDLRWALMTGAEVTLAGNQATLDQDGQRLHLSILEPAGAAFVVYPSDPPPAAHDEANPGTRLLGFTLALQAGATIRLRILLTPGSLGAAAAPESRALEDW